MKSKKHTIGDIVCYIIVGIVVLICMYPFLNVLSSSLSDRKPLLAGEVSFYPKGFQLDAYKSVLGMHQIWTSMEVSLFVTIVGTLLGLTLTIAAAYVLSRDRLRGRAIISGFILFTMYFGGGVIPTFLVVKEIGLFDSLWALIIPSSMSVFNFIIMRTFFREIPKEMEEAAIIDGAGDMAVLGRIFLPLSKPIMATVGLFYAVGYWNDYFSSLLYIQSGEKYSLQLRLRQMLFADSLSQVSQMAEATKGVMMTEALKNASIVVAVLPIILVYPWLQKYFVKGVMLGSVKG